jgi:ureidoacrylate peracid hydrolase
MPVFNSDVLYDGGAISIRPDPRIPRPPGSGSPLFLELVRTAVLVVDMQRGFLAVPAFAAMKQTIPGITEFLRLARAAGMTVIYLVTGFHAGMSDAGRIGSRTRQMMLGLGSEEDNSLLQNNPGAAVVPELTPEPSDMIITKTRFSGFTGTSLETVLRSRNVESLILLGATTTVCVESTVRDAMFLDFNALVLSDCTSDLTPELHKAALQRTDLFFGWVCSAKDLAPALEAASKIAAAL